MKKLRIYLDTSVIGGCLDDEFADASRGVLGLAKSGRAILLISDILVIELQRAPVAVQGLLEQIPVENVEAIQESAESRTLRDAYLAAGVVGQEHSNDAHHVALASLAGADMIVSWNFRHIVHHEKIRAFNAVNLREGYGILAIYSPLEVV